MTASSNSFHVSVMEMHAAFVCLVPIVNVTMPFLQRSVLDACEGWAGFWAVAKMYGKIRRLGADLTDQFGPVGHLAGLNAATGTFIFMGGYISEDAFLKLAGALQQGQWSKANAASIILFGTAFGPAPWYGEIPYTGRPSQAGIRAGVLRRK